MRKTGGVLFVVSAVPAWAVFNSLNIYAPHRDVVELDLRRADHRYDLVHKMGIRNHPLESLHAAHRDTHDGFDVIDAENFGKEFVLGVDHVAHGALRNL